MFKYLRSPFCTTELTTIQQLVSVLVMLVQCNSTTFCSGVSSYRQIFSKLNDITRLGTSLEGFSDMFKCILYYTYCVHCNSCMINLSTSHIFHHFLLLGLSLTKSLLIINNSFKAVTSSGCDPVQMQEVLSYCLTCWMMDGWLVK